VRGDHERDLKLDDSCISDPKSEISDWTGEYSSEMQESSNLKFFVTSISRGHLWEVAFGVEAWGDSPRLVYIGFALSSDVISQY
jgi:hypothetical protein